MPPEILPPRPPFASQFGFGWLNWGHGMIGKATAALVALMVVFCIVAARVPSELAMLEVLGAGVVIYFVYLLFLGYFARNHAALAATEGPTYIQSKQLDYAAKNITVPSLMTVIADPQNPTLLNQGSADG